MSLNLNNNNNDDSSPGYSNSPQSSNSAQSSSNAQPTSTSMFSGLTTAATTHSVTIKSMSFKKSIQPINQLFAEEEEDHSSFKKAKLTPSASLSEAKSQSDEKKKAVKKLVESIPTDRDELFAYQIDWSQVDQTLMEKRIRPWINKKIIEYIGEEEQSLNDFICTKIEQQTKPDKLLEEVKVILDDEAELFVKKMWRLLVYETESKRCGLSK
jgi:RNA-binding protein 25